MGAGALAGIAGAFERAVRWIAAHRAGGPGGNSAEPASDPACENVPANGVAGQSAGLHRHQHRYSNDSSARATPGIVAETGGLFLFGVVVCPGDCVSGSLALARLALSLSLDGGRLSGDARVFCADADGVRSSGARRRATPLRRGRGAALLFVTLLLAGCLRTARRARRHS